MTTAASILAPRGRGFTLTEVMVTLGILGVLSLAMIATTNVAVDYFQRSLAVSASHLDARKGVQNFIRDMHRSVASPRIATVDEDGKVSLLAEDEIEGLEEGDFIGEDGKFRQAVVIQLRICGPYALAESTVDNSKKAVVEVGDTEPSVMPVAGNMVVIPGFGLSELSGDGAGVSGIEKFITASPAAPAYSSGKITFYTDSDFEEDLEQTISVVDGRTGYSGGGNRTGVVQVYFTQPLAYVAEYELQTRTGEDGSAQEYWVGTLAQYRVTLDEDGDPALAGRPMLMTNRVVKPKGDTFMPFEIPVLTDDSGAPDAQSIAALKISTEDKQSSNRGYAATNMFIESEIPVRSELTYWNNALWE